MAGNTLAMLGEILSAQATAGGGVTGRTDAALYRTLGVEGSGDRPFRRVFPVGRHAGDGGMVFGDGTADGVFRGMGRGIGRLLTSPRFDDLVQYFIGNGAATTATIGEVGWGSAPDNIAWGSFGFASLSTGRDRYTEYAAERIARRSLDHVLDGFRRAGSTQGDTQQLADLWQLTRDRELRILHLPSQPPAQTMAQDHAVDATARDWFLSEDGVDRGALYGAARTAVDETIESLPRAMGGTLLSDWLGQVGAWASGRNTAVATRLEEVADDLAGAFAQRLVTNLREQTSRAIANLGVGYARFALEQIGASGGVISSLVPRVKGLEALRSAAALNVPSAFTQKYSVKKGQVPAAGDAELREDLARTVTDSAFGWLASLTAVRVADVLEDFRTAVIVPLSAEIDDVRRGLVAARSEQPRAVGIAQVASPYYQAWPEEPTPGQGAAAAVPDRFVSAHNEVLLMGPEQYVTRFGTDVLESVRAERAGDPAQDPQDVGQAYDRVREDVILGRWAQGAGDTPPDDLVVIDRTWVPRGIRHLAAFPTPASFSVNARAADLLGRARAFVARRGESFETFATESLRRYLTDESLGRQTRQEREDQVLDALVRVMTMAQPLVQINKSVQRSISAAGADNRRTYQFGDLPFAGLGELVSRIEEHVTSTAEINEHPILPALKNNLSANERTSIDVFGSYPATFPMAFGGLLSAVAQDWDSRKEPSQRAAFWQWRRARPLAGGLPFSDAERRALIRGWWVAQMAGGIQRPGTSASADAEPVRVWDRATAAWVDFPAPMLTPPSRMIHPNALLACVLESSLLAHVAADAQGLGVFRPWAVLRSWSDDGPDGPVMRVGGEGPEEIALRAVLSDGRVHPSLPEPSLLGGAADPESRRTALVGFCDAVIADLEAHYLPGPGKEDSRTSPTAIGRRDLVPWVPLSVDLAQEMHDAIVALRTTVLTVTVTDPGSGPVAFTPDRPVY
jgi:hypothetical protein